MAEHDDTSERQEHTDSEALSRLTPAQRIQLDNLVDSFAIAGMELTEIERDAAARLMLGEISFEEYLAETEPRPEPTPSDTGTG